MRFIISALVLGLTVLSQSFAAGADNVAAQALASMPVREVTVFKDGHAFLLHEGDVAPDAEGNVQLNYLPTPVIGTFWPYCADENASLAAVSSGSTRVEVEKPALQLRDLLQSNIGAEALIHESNEKYLATIVGVPFREPKETLMPLDGSAAPQRETGQVILLKTESGTKVVNVDNIRDVTFTSDPQKNIKDHEYRNLLKLRLDWNGRQPAERVRVGMTYLQKGIRWIPQYRITLKEDGQAQLELQATLLNEAADLNDVKAHLVIGVPHFAFKDTLDPIALNQGVAQLSQYFQQANQTAYAFSNAIMTQTARMSEVRSPEVPATGPEIPGADAAEDLFIFTIEHVTLKRGERMVASIGTWTVPYADRYTLHIPIAPPVEMLQNSNNQQQAEIAKLLHSPKVQHKIRLTNQLQVPLTTAPALLMADGRVLGQGMMTYAAPGGTADVDLTTAVNFAVVHETTERQRTPKAMIWNGYNLDRIDMDGVIRVTSFVNEPVTIEIVRETLGIIDEANQDAKIQNLGPHGDINSQPFWWQWYSWPGWWRHVVGMSRARWELTLNPRDSVEVQYKWHYFWAW